MSIKKKKKNKRRKKRKPISRRKSVSLSSASTPISSGASTSSSFSDSSNSSSSTSATNVTNSSVGSTASTPSTSQSNTSSSSSSSTSNTSDNTTSKKRRKKRNKKKRPRKRRGISLSATPASTDTTAPSSTQTETSTVSTDLSNKTFTQTEAQEQRWGLEVDIENEKARKIAKFKNKNPALYDKIQAVNKEHTEKIRAFADGLPDKDKAAFLEYSKSFAINSWVQKNGGVDDITKGNEDVDNLTGLDKKVYDYDKEILAKLGDKQQQKFYQTVKEAKAKRQEFRANLSPEDQADFDDFDASPRLEKMTELLESQMEEKDIADELDADLLSKAHESRKELFKLQQKQKNEELTEKDIDKIKNLNENLEAYLTEIIKRGI